MRFVCDCCHDLTNIEADRQIMLAKLTPTGKETKC